MVNNFNISLIFSLSFYFLMVNSLIISFFIFTGADVHIARSVFVIIDFKIILFGIDRRLGR